MTKIHFVEIGYTKDRNIKELARFSTIFEYKLFKTAPSFKTRIRFYSVNMITTR